MIKLDIHKMLHGAKGEMALSVNVNIEEGEFLALSGVSGSGKTTLLRILAGLESAKGTLTVGNEVWLDDKKSLAPQKRKIGYVFQDYALFPNMSVLENLLFVNDDKTLADRLLELTALHDMKERLPHTLSGGQQQRVSIARVLLKKPKLIFADEPTGNLDDYSSDDVMDVMLSYIKEVQGGLFIVTHDERIAARCDIAYRLKDKRLVPVIL